MDGFHTLEVQMQSDDFDAQVIRLLGALIFWAGCAVSVYLIGSQIYYFLQIGTWPAEGLMDWMAEQFQWQWAEYPTDWIGLHKILNFLNAGASVFFAGCAVGGWLYSFERN